MEIHSNILEYKINTVKYRRQEFIISHEKEMTEIKWKGNDNYFYSIIKQWIHVYCV